MGKLKKGRRNQRGRHNPLARKLAPDGVSKQETARHAKIAPLVAKLLASAPNDRLVALSAITVLAEDPSMRQTLLRERVIAAVMEHTLVDANEELVVDSLGLLRNLTIDEGYEVAKHLWRSGIWTHITSGLEKINSSMSFLALSLGLAEKKTVLMLFDYIENLLSLVVLIASCSSDLYDSIYQNIDPLMQLVVEVLAWNLEKSRSPKLLHALLDFLYEFASDSAEFVQALAAHPNFNLQSLVSSPLVQSSTLATIYAQGISFHFLEVTSAGEATEEIQVLLKNVFDTVTKIDIAAVETALKSPAKATEPVLNPKSDTENSLQENEKPKDIDTPLGGESPQTTKARADLQAIDISIDLLASICEHFAVSSEQPEVSPELLAYLLDTALPACLHLLAANLQLTSKVLAALNNMCWLFLLSSSIPVLLYEKIPTLWLAVETVLDKDWEARRSCLSILWALSKCLGPEVRSRVTDESVASTLSTCQEIVEKDDTDAFDFLLSAVGFLGTIAQNGGNVEATRQIGNFIFLLAEHYTKPTHSGKALEIPVECLNMIYDIFGDAEYDYDLPVFVEGNMLQRLREMEPAVKAYYKRIDKKKNPDLKLRAEEVWKNLGRFIDYKANERA